MTVRPLANGIAPGNGGDGGLGGIGGEAGQAEIIGIDGFSPPIPTIIQEGIYNAYVLVVFFEFIFPTCHGTIMDI